MPSLLRSIVFLSLTLTTLVNAQISASAHDGYTGYSLEFEGDNIEERDSVLYETASTPANSSTLIPPDVYLNASVHIGEIDILVANLSAKINLDAQVLNLLNFNAGVDASIDRVSLLIQNVTAKVLLEARLENLVLMISDVLDSIDLNPIIATLGNDVGQILNTTTGAIGDLTGQSSTLVPRSYNLVNNVLYSVNDYSGNTHTNRVLTQTGSIIDEFLDNDGIVHSHTVVGDFLKDMRFNGHNESVVRDGQVVRAEEYVYEPFQGLSVVSTVFIDASDAVVGTQVISESSAGGSSTVADSTEL